VSESADHAVKSYYDQKAQTYDDYNRQLYFKVYDAVTWRLTEPYLPRDSRALVLDAAGGTGKWTIPMAKCGARVVLADLSDGMLNMARKKIAEEGLQERIETRSCDLRKLDFKDESFDMVFCDHALAFIKEQDSVVSELVRVLKKGHPLIVSAQNRYVLSLSLVRDDAALAFRILSKDSPFALRDRVKVYALSPEEFRRLLENKGVRVEGMFGKVFTMPLGLSYEKLQSEAFGQDLVEKLLKIEFSMLDKPDAVSLGGHIQAVGYKR
jgi:2-polyprenyl-3-methyl-5-hydroxy-6-metoxy-1,4-benzoquinol methylase